MVDYFLLSPTGNITVLVKTPVSRAAQAETARDLMKETEAEQVGFIEPPQDKRARARLQMAGGEFCGNAAMSLAAVLARKDGLSPGEEVPIILESSGSEVLVHCDIRRIGEAIFSGKLHFPMPTAITQRELPVPGGSIALTAVSFPGITHVILPYEKCGALGGDLKEQAEAVIKLWARELETGALGIMMLDEAKLTMTPLVYVAEPETLCWETGCCSGTAAAGAYLAVTQGQSGSFSLTQPGGIMTARAEVENGTLTHLTVIGGITLMS